MLGERLEYCLVGEALLLDFTQALHFGFGFVLQLREQRLLVLDCRLLVGEGLSLLLQFLLCSFELVDRAAADVRDHVDQHFGLHLVFRCLHAGQQRNALGAAGGEASDRERLDVAPKLVDTLFECVGAALHPDRVVLEYLEVGLRLEVGRSGRVGAVACRLDLPCRLASSVLAALGRGVGGYDRSKRDRRAEREQQYRERAAQASQADAEAARMSVETSC